MSSSTLAQRHPTRRRSCAAIAAAASLTLVLLPAAPASAHHGWDGFDTDHLVYLAGSVSSAGSWGEPHSLFDVDVDQNLPADTPELAIPEELQDPADSSRIEIAPSYEGQEEELQVIIAPPAYSGRWGLDRALTVGERFQGVGYINRTDQGLFRPVAFWFGDDATPVNQVLGNTLPVRAPLPGATSSSQATAGTGEAASARASETRAVWAVFGMAAVAAAVGGVVYLRRRTRQG